MITALVIAAQGCGSSDDEKPFKARGSGGSAGEGGQAGTGGGVAGQGGAPVGGAGGMAGVGGPGGVGGMGGTGGQAGASGSAGMSGSGGSMASGVTCASTPPPGAEMPPPAPTYAGTCPTLVSGLNQIQTGGATREFLLVVPDTIAPGEQLPLGFLWHWLGGDANAFLTKGEVQAAANEQRFIAVIPEADPNPINVFKWPYTIVSPPSAVSAELQFFDDMFACVAEQFDVNLSCVASAGVSAGALWTAQLAGHRGQHLSSALVLSGGTGVAQVQPFMAPSHKLPYMVLWGGPTDVCVTVAFEQASLDLEQNLTANGHFLIECLHNCGHVEPPFDPPPGESKFAGLWQFWLDHPYWLAAGDSPYLADGLPANVPPWCGIGPGSATPRTGMCPPPACPF